MQKCRDGAVTSAHDRAVTEVRSKTPSVFTENSQASLQRVRDPFGDLSTTRDKDRAFAIDDDMGITNLFRSTSTDATKATAAASATKSGLSDGSLKQLSASNPRFDALLKELPGLGKFLEKNSVSPGPRDGEAKTEVTWSVWTHSEQTNKKYGHGMTDKQVLSDLIVVMQPSADPGASVKFGYNSYPGQEIVGVYRTGDVVRNRSSAYDGGHLGEFDVVGHGKKGEQAVMGWAIVSVDDSGNVRGGGYPTARGGKLVPYQDQKGAGGGGGEYWGRAARIEHGKTNNYVPLTDN